MYSDCKNWEIYGSDYKNGTRTLVMVGLVWAYVQLYSTHTYRYTLYTCISMHIYAYRLYAHIHVHWNPQTHYLLRKVNILEAVK